MNKVGHLNTQFLVSTSIFSCFDAELFFYPFISAWEPTVVFPFQELRGPRTERRREKERENANEKKEEREKGPLSSLPPIPLFSSIAAIPSEGTEGDRRSLHTSVRVHN